MKSALRLISASSIVFAAATLAPYAAGNVDAAFQAFWDARTPREAAAAVPGLVASGVGFDEALKRLKAGRSYSAKVRKGVVTTSYRANGLEFFYALNVPGTYDPARKYQARIHLHGGVSRETNGVRGDGTIGALAGAEQIYIIPYGWNDAPWWADNQIENIRTILDTVKRTYNVDENRVAVAGVSDGGTGAYYVAMRDPTPYASFLPLNGFIMVLPSVGGAGDLFPNNLRNKPFFVVNGGKDPLYPMRAVEPYVNHLKAQGVEIEYRPQVNGAHNTAWWPDVVNSFEAFVASHPRNPLPDKLTWQTSGTRFDNRADWLIIDKLAAHSTKDEPLADPNRMANGQLMFENTDANGRVDLMRTGNSVSATTRGVAEFTLLLSPDVFDFSKPVRIDTNGRVAFEGSVAKSVATLAKWAAHDNDRTMLFGAELHVKVR